MFRSVFGTLISSTLLLACTTKNNGIKATETAVEDTGSTSQTNEVFSASTFTVTLRSDEVYGQGQTHSGWNVPDPAIIDLKLDLYIPDNDGTERPLVGWCLDRG